MNMPRQRRRSHVGLHPNRHGNGSAVDVSQLFGHREGEAVVETQASELCNIDKSQDSTSCQELELEW